MSVVKHNIFYELLMIWYAFLVSHAPVFKAKVNARSSTPLWHAFFYMFRTERKKSFDMLPFVDWHQVLFFNQPQQKKKRKKECVPDWAIGNDYWKCVTFVVEGLGRTNRKWQLKSQRAHTSLAIDGLWKGVSLFLHAHIHRRTRHTQIHIYVLYTEWGFSQKDVNCWRRDVGIIRVIPS